MKPQVYLVVIGLVILGCTPPPRQKFEKFTEFIKAWTDYKQNGSGRIEFDSLEAEIIYFPQDSLDMYFYNLNLTSMGGALYAMKQTAFGTDDQERIKRVETQARVRGIKKCISQQHLLSSQEIACIEEYLYLLEPVVLTRHKGWISFANTRELPGGLESIPETARNPYNVADLIGTMRLDVFRISLTNRSSQTKYVNPRDFFLLDDLGNQQAPIERDFFESLFMKAPVERQKPARYANIQRSLLQNTPIFAFQTRKSFLAFYPIAAAAKTVELRWLPEGGQPSEIKWSFAPIQEVSRFKYLNVGIKLLPPEEYGPEWVGIKNMLVFYFPFGQVASADYGGCAGLNIPVEDLGNPVKICAVGAGNPKTENGKNMMSVFWGGMDLSVDLDGGPNTPVYFKIQTEKYSVELDE